MKCLFICITVAIVTKSMLFSVENIDIDDILRHHNPNPTVGEDVNFDILLGKTIAPSFFSERGIPAFWIFESNTTKGIVGANGIYQISGVFKFRVVDSGLLKQVRFTVRALANPKNDDEMRVIEYSKRVSIIDEKD